MSSLIKWAVNSADQPEAVWWKDTSIDFQIICERHLRSTHRGDSRVFATAKNGVLYTIDLSMMEQRNTSTGTLRTIRRTETVYTEDLTVSFRPSKANPKPPALFPAISMRPSLFVAELRKRNGSAEWKTNVQSITLIDGHDSYHQVCTQ